MVSRAEGDFSPTPSKSTDSLPSAASRMFEVIVPVYLKVLIKADDELHAEVLAHEALRANNAPVASGPATIQFHAILGAVVK